MPWIQRAMLPRSKRLPSRRKETATTGGPAGSHLSVPIPWKPRHGAWWGWASDSRQEAWFLRLNSTESYSVPVCLCVCLHQAAWVSLSLHCCSSVKHGLKLPAWWTSQADERSEENWCTKKLYKLWIALLTYGVMLIHSIQKEAEWGVRRSDSGSSRQEWGLKS